MVDTIFSSKHDNCDVIITADYETCKFHCYACLLNPIEISGETIYLPTVCDSKIALLDHLTEHLREGHKIPKNVLNRIMEFNDEKFKLS